jgi:hypothetical protein
MGWKGVLGSKRDGREGDCENDGIGYDEWFNAMA